MTTRTKVAIFGGIILIMLLYIAYFLQKNQPSEYTEEHTEINSSISATKNVKANETADRIGESLDKAKAQKEWRIKEVISDKTANYRAFDSKVFREAKGNRILFFHDVKDRASKKMETFLKDNLKEFPKDTTFFAVDFNNSKELTEYYNVTQANILINFDKDGGLLGVYSSEEPSVALVKQALSLK